MRRVAVGLASLIAVCFTGPVSSESEFEAIQSSEQPGSQINFTFGGGSGLSISRANGGPLFGGAGRAFFGGGVGAADGNLDLPPDPDTPLAGDPVDNALPGEGPEDLSGPGDESWPD
jgi:hypothetical protein